MAKMNKTAAVNAAKALARRTAAVTDLSLESITAMNYDEKKGMARVIARDTTLPETYAQYEAAVVEGFVDGAMGFWANKVQARENERRSWRRSLDGITVEDAFVKVAERVASMGIRGLRVQGEGSFAVARLSTWEDARLWVRFDRKWDDKIINPDNANQAVWKYTMDAQVSVGGTSYTPAQMSVMIKIQQELTDAANELLAVFASVNVIDTWGIEEEKAEETPAAAEEPAGEAVAREAVAQ